MDHGTVARHRAKRQVLQGTLCAQGLARPLTERS